MPDTGQRLVPSTPRTLHLTDPDVLLYYLDALISPGPGNKAKML